MLNFVTEHPLRPQIIQHVLLIVAEEWGEYFLWPLWLLCADSRGSLTKTRWFEDFGEFVSLFESLTSPVSVWFSHSSMSISGNWEKLWEIYRKHKNEILIFLIFVEYSYRIIRLLHMFSIEQRRSDEDTKISVPKANYGIDLSSCRLPHC